MTDVTIMVLEDEIHLSALLTDIFAERGWAVAGPFRTNRDAADYLSRNRPTAAVLDFNVADGNCKPTATRLKSIDVPFSMVSAFPKALARDAIFEEAQWIQKPFRVAALLQQLSSMVAQARV